MPLVASLDSSRSPSPGSFLSPVITQSLAMHAAKACFLSITTMRCSGDDSLRKWLAAIRPPIPPPKTRTVLLLLADSLAEVDDAGPPFRPAHQGGHGRH